MGIAMRWSGRPEEKADCDTGASTAGIACTRYRNIAAISKTNLVGGEARLPILRLLRMSIEREGRGSAGVGGRVIEACVPAALNDVEAGCCGDVPYEAKARIR